MRTRDRVLNYVNWYCDDRGYAPAIQDICDQLGLYSKSTVHAHLINLEKAGYIMREHEKVRAMRVTTGGKAHLRQLNGAKP